MSRRSRANNDRSMGLDQIGPRHQSNRDLPGRECWNKGGTLSLSHRLKIAKPRSRSKITLARVPSLERGE